MAGTLVLLAVLGLRGLVTPSAQRAPPCRPPRADSALAWRLVDSLRAGGPEARLRRVEFNIIAVPTSLACYAAVALRWDGGLGGAIAVLTPSLALSYLMDYPGVHDLRRAGANRIAFSYVAGHGSGGREERFVVLCSFGTLFWQECLDVVTLDERRLWDASSRSRGPRGLAVRASATVKIRGDKVWTHRRFAWAIIDENVETGRWHSRDLGSTVYALP